MKLIIGEIVKAQGIKGEVKVRPVTDDPSRFGRLGAVLVGGCPLKLRSASVRGDFVYIAFEGITDRNAAETLVGKKIEIDRSQARRTGEDEYFIVDLVGCKVLLSDGKLLGTLTAVDNYGSADIFTVEGERTVRFPFLKRLKLAFDGQARTITIDKDRFDEVCCYED